jgi:hypothetical protein
LARRLTDSVSLSLSLSLSACKHVN